jgi:hypothetical protein
MWQRGWLGGLLGVLVLAGGGCGGSGTVKVRGTVTLDGKPLRGAVVTFVPSGEKGRAASGATQADGSFQLTTFKPDDGALPGDYKVTVRFDQGVQVFTDANIKEAKEKHELDKLMDTPEGQAKLAALRRKLPPSPVPAVYSAPERTPLTQKVPPDGPVQFDLSSKTR